MYVVYCVILFVQYFLEALLLLPIQLVRSRIDVKRGFWRESFAGHQRRRNKEQRNDPLISTSFKP
ncbi:hypothetical protein HanRHA438_Chr10g0464471 [Helianthus annuus]|nr:hypothetical protein HanHA89_Chr10g0393341 [Helianthus annuus]KAJ0697605.1 hypothetical protein HanLR1_Chr10g0370781 [Helianthus annuus]KAJ0880556.1 hypothetical protein HanRHA438_Chr10g0464471 [Helianthus annuus]KAJ0884620.1 hypothetical protein HanPSC8_Chr10g0435881 [Helianthus annuus]